ncbi:hypothetical protein CROQUDRAFT_675078 [Cronartium quercuum f. sp. fusiforme G11]|uniref:Sucrase/ferredoxin-like-domain-containing protein n=1 Tax=Cronartium quercuum f. sp. fusiforme G11 TaxID=708437 RepID=A0A9P6N5E1_9BASI|nr:hypothetical protein CROQUDRAFT_675078 [Cronartium quercuum f. sp. fusiforme G11]
MSAFFNALLARTNITSSPTPNPSETSSPSGSVNTQLPTRHFPSLDTLTALRAAGVPLSIESEADCATCTQTCSAPIDMKGYPRAFSIDTTTPLLGTIKPFDYLILCSSSKTDWPRDVCENVNQVPGALRKANPKPTADTPKLNAEIKPRGPPGIFPLPKTPTEPPQPPRVSILSSSHISSSEDSNAESLIILPNWVLLPDVTSSNVPKLPLTSSYKPTQLPHNLIILLCSHKTRDKRCAIAAPILREALTEAFEAIEGTDWRVDTRADDLSSTTDHLVGIFQVSHSGGHKFAGNMIIFFPNGASVWYGRVTPSDCERIVQETVIGHKIIPELLKGGFGLGTIKSNNLDW